MEQSGDIVDVRWCPFGIADDENTHLDLPVSWAGTLAVVCGNGESHVMQLPATLKTTTTGDGSDEVDVPLMDAKAVTIAHLVVPNGAIAVQSEPPHHDHTPIAICAIDWSPRTPNLLCGSLADGSAAAWYLSPPPSSSSGIAIAEEDSPMMLRPSRHFLDLSSRLHAHGDRASRSVSLCPFADLLALGKGDGSIYIWDLNGTRPSCIIPGSLALGPITSLAWDPCGQGIFSASLHSSEVRFHYIWHEPWCLHRTVLPTLRSSLYCHGHAWSPAWRLSSFHQNGMPCVASVSADGSLRACAAVNAVQSKRRSKQLPPATELMRVVSVCPLGKVEEEGLSAPVSAASGVKAVTRWVTVDVLTVPRRIMAPVTTIARPVEPVCGLHAIDTCAFQVPGTDAAVPSSGGTLLVCGGTQGLVRLQLI